MCMGKYCPIRSVHSTAMESPPCVWGVHGTKITTYSRERITPMCMGST